MNSDQTRVGNAARDVAERFWDKFSDRAKKNGVTETAVCWHVRHAEAYLKAFSDKSLRQRTREDVAGYLQQAGELDRMADWGFVQIVDAIQNLLTTAGAPVAEAVYWGFWRARTVDALRPISEQGPHYWYALNLRDAAREWRGIAGAAPTDLGTVDYGVACVAVAAKAPLLPISEVAAKAPLLPVSAAAAAHGEIEAL